MKILFDYQAFYIQDAGGVSNSFVQLMRHLPSSTEVKLAMRESDNVHLQGQSFAQDVRPASCTKRNFISTRHYPLKGDLYKVFSKLAPGCTTLGRNKRYAIRLLEAADYDIFHPTFFDEYFLPHLYGRPFVLTIHDMIPELYFKRGDMQIERKRHLVKHAAHIVAVSEHTKADIVELLHVDPQMISVIHHGPPALLKPAHWQIFDFPYLLYVGKRTSYKNFAAMLPALQHFFREHPDWRMVCTLVPFTKKELAAFSALGLAQHFVFARPDDAELLALYRDAQAFIFPSLYEGFGIPILEAYQMDCPVLLNRKSCFPEVAGEAALYFNLDETQDNLLDCLQTLAAMSTTAKVELLCKQRERLKIYAWQKAGNALHDVYLKVKAQGGRAKR